MHTNVISGIAWFEFQPQPNQEIYILYFSLSFFSGCFFKIQCSITSDSEVNGTLINEEIFNGNLQFQENSTKSFGWKKHSDTFTANKKKHIMNWQIHPNLFVFYEYQTWNFNVHLLLFYDSMDSTFLEVLPGLPRPSACIHIFFRFERWIHATKMTQIQTKFGIFYSFTKLEEDRKKSM